ncbi:hypothetical protein BOTBODRAFT_189554 [Botryobasidium botryosum FD-172 SS1]|uniref:Cytochrome P450 n=1 Tax=Botryobasidium botryosum (strain FD-172 SS1) TaxID=930990 RepID=A0A067M8J6_BOTB1|nr:hypothetical protein BOTBODRAFT_189554 [Botryobasidium botryosum FD-172 SS1]
MRGLRTADATNTAILVLLLGASFAIFRLYRVFAALNPRRLPLPPGPKPELIFGNSRQIPPRSAWIQYTEWKKAFGDVIHLSAFGNHIVVLNTYESAHELLHLRSSYTSRPVTQMVGKMIGLGRIINLMPSNETWKRGRKLMHPVLNKESIRLFFPSFEGAIRTCLLQLLTHSGDFSEHLRLFGGKSILLFTYGIKVESAQDELIVISDEAIEPALQYFHIGAAFVDILPILRYIPSWFPGAEFKRNAKAVREKVDRMVELPFNRVKAAMAAGTATPSFTLRTLQDGTYSEHDQLWSSGSMYIAGADTTSANMNTFILAMALYPDVQRRAQAEIDRVVPKGTLPGFQDRDSLPYVDCLLKELQRWRPAIPLGVQRCAMKDDYYGGYYIPKGAIVSPNVWAITRDEANYKDPERFWPERFENPETAELDPYKYAFGFGRRTCAGLHFADASIYIAVVSILATFDVGKPKDENGNEVELNVPHTSGFIS